MSYGEISTRRKIRRNVPRQNVFTVKCPYGEMSHGEVSHGKKSHGEMSGHVWHARQLVAKQHKREIQRISVEPIAPYIFHSS